MHTVLSNVYRKIVMQVLYYTVHAQCNVSMTFTLHLAWTRGICEQQQYCELLHNNSLHKLYC